jgi:hypothetical protein
LRKATRITATALGIFAGIGGPEHGYFEILRGNTRPESLMIAAMGPPCVPEEVWHACEPAMTIIPNYLVTGILATLLGIVTMIWAAGFVHKKRGWLVLLLLCLALLLFGGGLFPPLIGIFGSVLASRIHAPVTKTPTRITGALATLWPWTLVVFIVGLFSQFVIGHFFNEFMLNSGFLIPISIVGVLILSIVSAIAYDRAHAEAG